MCKYQLTADCVGHTFSIRVTNDGRSTKSSSWTKTVTLKVNNLKVNLGQKMRVKVNGTRVDLPFVLYSAPPPTTSSPVIVMPESSSRSSVSPTALMATSFTPVDEIAPMVPEVEIRMTEEGVSVVTRMGVQLLWDGTNFLQVQAPVTYKNRLCGLCGNYNGVSRDDLRTRRGVNMNDSMVWDFANSWRVGGTKQCSDKFNENYGRKQSGCKYRKKAKLCDPLHGLHWIFEACTERVNPNNYFESCKKDMCECESDLCYCDSFTAYAHECQRLGVRLRDWRQETGCTLNAMRNGALVLPRGRVSSPRWGVPTSVSSSSSGALRERIRGRHRVNKKPLELQRLEEKIPLELIAATEKGRKRGRGHTTHAQRRRARLRGTGSNRVEAAGRSDKRIPLPLKE